jgi:hypothetical protein
MGKLSTISVAKIQSMQFEAMDWLVTDMIPAVGLTFLTGRPKRGKSWLGLQLAGAVGTGGMFLGKQVKQGKVLYLALEDNNRRIQDRTSKQMWNSNDVEIVTVGGLRRLETGGFMDLKETIESNGYRVVILDTLKKATGYDPSKDEINKVMSPLHEIAHTLGIAIIVIHHNRKPGNHESDVIDDVMGNTAISGAADTIMGLYRDTGKQDAMLKLTGRDVDEGEMNLSFDALTCTWQMTNGSCLPDKGAKGRLVSAVLALKGDGRTTRNVDIAQRANMNTGNCSKLLGELVRDQILTKDVMTANYDLFSEV